PDTPEGFRCVKCKREVVSKRIVVEKGPDLLAVLVKRLHFEQSGAKAGSTSKVSTPMAVADRLAFGKRSYRLHGLALHLGASWKGGHYTAYGTLLCVRWVVRDRACLLLLLQSRMETLRCTAMTRALAVYVAWPRSSTTSPSCATSRWLCTKRRMQKARTRRKRTRTTRRVTPARQTMMTTMASWRLRLKKALKM